MKTKLTFAFAIFFMGLSLGYAQQDEECMTKLSIFHEYVKAKNYDAAYGPWKDVREKCPKLNIATYSDGEKILEHKIENSSGAEQVANINDLLKLYDQRLENFPDKTKKGELLGDKAQLMYDYKKELGLSDMDVYNAFDKAFTVDKATFNNPKGLYTYFSLMVDLYDAKEKSAQDLFDKYDDVTEKVESEVGNYSEDLNKLIAKEEANTPLSSKEEKYKRYYESYLTNYDKISAGIDKKLGDRANCENLIPLYTKNFEANKTNAQWLQRAAGKMSEKDCTSDPLFFKLVHAYHELSPSANSAYYLGILKDKEGDSNGALKYYEQALSLEKDNFKKAKLNEKIGNKLKAKGSYAKAREYYRQSLKLNPSNGRPHLNIAAMYASSANNCGDTTFNKRAVYWLAADEAKKAGKVDPTLKSAAQQSVASYMAKAPQKGDIFSQGNQGQSIKINCWIGTTITVPNL
ncbi:tetratricopeptide repeat protein [Mangrovimonas aestuarii]|uniref:tetratricopeptide repeat protein n=1 Tax=Mangrovimonas aestuarii TaxID=3018443 RepID=UPI0023792EED|nr:tetratricopeptide repeat protein [Mangrovimonas aestuarii]